MAAVIAMGGFRGGRTLSKVELILFTLLFNILMIIGIITVAMTRVWFANVALVTLWMIYNKNAYETYEDSKKEWEKNRK